MPAIKTYLHFDYEEDRFFVPVPFSVIRSTGLKPNQELYLECENGIMLFSPEQITENAILLKLEQLCHSPEGFFITIPTLILAKLMFKPRQMFNLTVSGKTISYDPYNKTFGYIGRKERYVFDTNPKILKEYKSEDRAAEFEIYNQLFKAGVNRLEWMKGMNIH